MDASLHDTVRIGIIGDYDGRPSHLATVEAIRHCATILHLNLSIEWLPTITLEHINDVKLSDWDALWCSPGSPYQSAQGAMNAIRYAREKDIPFIGTCGGFQHTVLEYAHDVLEYKEVCEAAFDPYSSNLFITSLSCSLLGETRCILLPQGTRTGQIYQTAKTIERYNCSFGLNLAFTQQLIAHGMVVAGTDEASGDPRILELAGNRFFIATLFQPQLSSTPSQPHPLILAFLRSAFNKTII